MLRATLRPITLALVLSAIALGCTKIDYDTSQQRDWVEAYTWEGDTFPNYIDKSSVKPSEEGVQFDEMTKKREQDGIHSAVATYTLNCQTGAYTMLQITWLDAKGKAKQQEKRLSSFQVASFNAPTYQALCQQVGLKPEF
ncbi:MULTISPECIES: surface-adhesin E family protein [Trichocoleus]|uniref:Surface-adhesin protein E-like domain-containing protein n=1 Tax=Trichocoleus desertorum GB2-A4 TaxID=2933944 RepID=A0ABV0JG16_9CYAN|nr:surface-adhesin E family protein [Trichocoleus sp. FACHB-46]MBD1865671.1 hypothetical protein [Trichocoleus sp. FACHB-46]